MKRSLYVLGVMVLAGSVQALLGAIPPVPEIDGGMVVSGVGLLAGGLMVLRARIRS
jgi:hypothetical protein